MITTNEILSFIIGLLIAGLVANIWYREDPAYRDTHLEDSLYLDNARLKAINFEHLEIISRQKNEKAAAEDSLRSELDAYKKKSRKHKNDQLKLVDAGIQDHGDSGLVLTPQAIDSINSVVMAYSSCRRQLSKADSIITEQDSVIKNDTHIHGNDSVIISKKDEIIKKQDDEIAALRKKDKWFGFALKAGGAVVGAAILANLLLL